ncbi:hypothetical protein K799_17542, partial [Salmonella enterica subsp. enterica serovar Newport str. SHSN009]
MVVVPVLEPSPPPVAANATPTAELTVLTLVAEELPADTDVAADPKKKKKKKKRTYKKKKK